MVARDCHIAVTKALYSISHSLVGERRCVRADRQLVKAFHRGQLVKVHPRQAPGGRSTDPQDLPDDKRASAMRDLEYLKGLRPATVPPSAPTPSGSWTARCPRLCGFQGVFAL